MSPSDAKKKELFEKLKQFSKENGFELLTPEWTGSKVKHQFRHIESGKEYEVIPNNIFIQGFPKDLRTDKDRYSKLKRFSKENGFKLLTPEWLGVDVNHQFLHIETDKKYEWPPYHIFIRGFPKDLRTNDDRHKELKKKSEESGYVLMTPKWLGSNIKHQFRHIESGEIREWIPSQIQRVGFPLLDGQRYVTQEVCRQVFVHIFGGEFKTNRERLKAKNGGQTMELDGYEEFDSAPNPLKSVANYVNKAGAEVAFNLPIAFEFQGHRSHREHKSTVDRDKLKAKLCEEEGVLLVQIEPPCDEKEYKIFFGKVRNSDFMYAYICNAIQAAVGANEKIDFPPGFQVDLSNWNPDKERYAELKAFSEECGYELQTPKWLGALVKHKLRHIESGVKYWGVPTKILNGRGFPKNLLNPRNDKNHHYEKLKRTAKDSGFELLTPEWLGAVVKHQFRHIETGNEYWGQPNNIGSQGFPKDLRTDKDKYSKLKRFSVENGFKLLTPEWLGSQVKHQFQYVETGEVYEGVPDHILNGSGFPKRFLNQNQPQPDQISPALITSRIATLNELTQPFSNGLDMFTGQAEEVTRIRERIVG